MDKKCDIFKSIKAMFYSKEWLTLAGFCGIKRSAPLTNITYFLNEKKQIRHRCEFCTLYHRNILTSHLLKQCVYIQIQLLKSVTDVIYLSKPEL